MPGRLPVLKPSTIGTASALALFSALATPALAQFVDVAQRPSPAEPISDPAPAPTRFALHLAEDAEEDSAAFYTGRLKSETGAFPCFATWKINPDGTTAWLRSITDTAATDCYGVAVTSNGSRVFAAGVVIGENGKDIVTVCYDAADGDIIWERRYNNAIQGVNGDDAPVVVRATESDVYVAGTSAGASGGFSTGLDYVVLKYRASDGLPQWGEDVTGNAIPARYNGPANGKDTVADLALGGTGNGSGITSHIFVTGTSAGVLSGDDYATIRIHVDNPVVVGAIRYASAGNDTARDIAYNGNALIVTGDSWQGISTGYDLVTIRYEEFEGGEEWVAPFDNSETHSEDRAADLEVDKNGNAYVTGRTKGVSGNDADIVAVSFLAETGGVRWVEEINGVPTGRDYVTYNGTGSGTDFGAAIRVTTSGGPIDHDGDVVVLGQVTALGAGGAKVQRYGVVRLDQCDPDDGEDECN